MKTFLSSLKVLAEPTRLRLLLLLREEDLTVAEMQEILNMGQSRISSHLSQLKGLGLVRSRRVGKNIFYEAIPFVEESLEEVLKTARSCLEEAKRDQLALQLCLRKRRDRATEYFNRLAGKFGRTYIPGRSWRALSHALLRLLPPMTIADLGAGEGTLSMLLARNARKVIAVDNSEKMVEYGKKTAKENRLTKLEYRLGDIESPPISDASVDLALLSQVLHHASNPARAVREACRILRPGGRIMIMDLAAHNYEQARELYAHLWLGFSELELHEMLKDAGFKNVESEVIAADPQMPQFRTILATAFKPVEEGVMGFEST